MNLGYTYTVDRDVLPTLVSTRKSDRDRLLRAFAELADNPFVEGEFRRRSSERSDVVTWWVDHPVKIVRVTDVTLIPLPE
jgi:hypothetical protein